MMWNFVVKAWGKIDSDPSAYLRLAREAGWQRRRVVIVDFQGAMGDLVCFFSSLPGLRARHPGCLLVFATFPDYLDLVRGTGLVDLAVARYGLLHFAARQACRPNDYYTPTSGGTGLRTGKVINPPMHTAQHFAQLLGVEPRMDLVYLRTSPALRNRMAWRVAAVNPDALPLVVVHPGPTWAVREWPASSWAQWGAEVQAHLPVRVIQIGTEAGRSELHAHAAVRVPGSVDWVNGLSLMETVALLEQARVFVGIDSGPLHLATTLGLPTIGLFGPVNGLYRAHPRARFRCLIANVPCLGCHHDPAGEIHWRTGCPYDIRCMEGISVEEVFLAIQEELKEEAPRPLAPIARPE